jgi:hypothetical protein
VQCLPSDFYGEWKQPDPSTITNIISADMIESSSTTVSSLTWEAVINDGSREHISIIDYPCGFYLTGNRPGFDDYDVQLLIHTNKMSIYRANALYERVN